MAEADGSLGSLSKERTSPNRKNNTKSPERNSIAYLWKLNGSLRYVRGAFGNIFDLKKKKEFCYKSIICCYNSFKIFEQEHSSPHREPTFASISKMHLIMKQNLSCN